MFSSFSIRLKLILQTLVPTVTIVILAMILINSKYSEVNNLEDLQKTEKLLSSISLLLHETQKERGMSAAYLGSGGKNFKDKLSSQRKLTDTKLSELKKIVVDNDIADIDSKIDDAIMNAIADSSKIDSISSKISSLEIETPKAIA